MASFLIIKQKDAAPTILLQQLVIEKSDVSVLYSESEREVRKFTDNIGGTLFLVMKSGKEFKFKYKHHSLANSACLLLAVAIQAEKTVEIEI
ncbi:MAG: hypothetical protein ACRYG7_23100 [Janthinobacterium lividum]